MTNKATHHIGVFDSGIGGLSVANAIYGLLPDVAIHYFADTARVPYGPRPVEEIRAFAHEITAKLLRSGAQIIVLACNTATGAALNSLRERWPDVPFVGMEPAVKPAAKESRQRKVGVLATASTIGSERYAALMEQYAAEVEVFENPCVGLVPLIERGLHHSDETRALLMSILMPMLAQGVDTLVLGCTHYPFVLPLIKDIAGPGVSIIDPAPAVARQVVRRLESLQLLEGMRSDAPQYIFEASGNHATLDMFSAIPFIKKPSPVS